MNRRKRRERSLSYADGVNFMDNWVQLPIKFPPYKFTNALCSAIHIPSCPSWSPRPPFSPLSPIILLQNFRLDCRRKNSRKLCNLHPNSVTPPALRSFACKRRMGASVVKTLQSISLNSTNSLTTETQRHREEVRSISAFLSTKNHKFISQF